MYILFIHIYAYHLQIHIYIWPGVCAFVRVRVYLCSRDHSTHSYRVLELRWATTSIHMLIHNIMCLCTLYPQRDIDIETKTMWWILVCSSVSINWGSQRALALAHAHAHSHRNDLKTPCLLSPLTPLPPSLSSLLRIIVSIPSACSLPLSHCTQFHHSLSYD